MEAYSLWDKAYTSNCTAGMGFNGSILHSMLIIDFRKINKYMEYWVLKLKNREVSDVVGIVHNYGHSLL